MSARMFLVFNYTRNLGDHVATTFDFHPIADLYPEAFNLIHVVESGAAHGCAANWNWLQCRDRREFSCTSDLHEDVLDLSNSSPRCVLVRDRPARCLTRESKFILQGNAVNFDDNPVNLIGEAFPIAFRFCNEGMDSLEILGQSAERIDLEPGSFQCIQCFPVAAKISPPIL